MPHIAGLDKAHRFVVREARSREDALDFDQNLIADDDDEPPDPETSEADDDDAA